MVWLGERWTPPSDIAQESPHGMSAKKSTIPDQSSPGSPRTAPAAVHQGRVVEKWITGVPKKIMHPDLSSVSPGMQVQQHCSEHSTGFQ